VSPAATPVRRLQRAPERRQVQRQRPVPVLRQAPSAVQQVVRRVPSPAAAPLALRRADWPAAARQRRM
jgi:hypothetical protein